MDSDLSGLTLSDLYSRLAETGLPARLFALARDEDLGPNGMDLTASLLGESSAVVSAAVRAREAGVAAGLAALPDLLGAFDAELEMDVLVPDGDAFGAGDSLLAVRGVAFECVRIERTLLNLLSRLCGVATRTRAFVDAVAGRAELLDTRKTTPGLRVLEKYAVRCGGGVPHRLGLYDAVLVKDNHLAALRPEDWTGFFHSLRSRREACRFVEIEVDTHDQLREVLRLDAGVVDFVLLDNMTPDELRRAVAMRDEARSAVLLEASGGVTLETVGVIAETGVDRISVGSLTHRALWVDLGLDVDGALESDGPG